MCRQSVFWIFGFTVTNAQLLPLIQNILSGGDSLGNNGLLSQAVSALEGIKSKIDTPALAQFAGQLRDIFQQPEYAYEERFEPTPEPTSSPTHLTHSIRGVDARSPFDLSQLAEQEAQHEIIQLTPSEGSILPGRINTILGSFSLANAFSGVNGGNGLMPGLINGLLGAQSRLAHQRNLGPVSYASETDLPPKRGLQGVSGSSYSLLNNVLGVPGKPGGLYGRFDEVPVQSSVPQSSAASLLRQALKEEEEMVKASRLKRASNDYHVEKETPADSGSDSEDSSMDAYQECFVPNSIVIGPEDLVMKGRDILHCQSMCQQNIRCKYCSFKFDEKLCYHYTEAERLQGTKMVISAPKVCPGRPPPVSKREARNQEAAASYVQMEGQKTSSEPDYSSGGRKEEQALVGMLSGLVSGASAPQLLNAATSMMTTGSQFMGAIPFKELAQAGLTLVENGYLRNRGVTRGLGSRTRDKTSVPPPPGSGSPTVTCHSQGMTCCIPRTAVNDWQKHMPYLNQYKNTDTCRSVYVTGQDTLCVTSVYDAENDRDRCGVQVTQTSDLTVYRNILTVPNKSMNNALCECIHKPISDDEEDATPKGSARWEFSLVATENAKSKLDQTEESATRLVKGAQAAQVLSQIFSGNHHGTQQVSQGAPGVAAMGDMIGLASNLGSFMNQRRAAKIG